MKEITIYCCKLSVNLFITLNSLTINMKKLSDFEYFRVNFCNENIYLFL